MYALSPTMLPDPDLRPELYDDTPSKRAMAWVVDVVITSAATLIVIPFTAFTGLFFLPLLYAVVGFCYRWATLARGSATWGMRLMSIEIRRADGEHLDAGTAWLHTAGYALSWIAAPVQIVSAAMMCGTPRRQGLTDLVLGTAAVNRTG